MFTLCVILWFSMMFIENTFFNMSTYGTAINALIVKYSSQLFKYICICINSLQYKTGFMSISKANSWNLDFIYLECMYRSLRVFFCVSVFGCSFICLWEKNSVYFYYQDFSELHNFNVNEKYQSEYILFIEMKHSHLEICMVEK